MKKINIKLIPVAILIAMTILSCKQDMIELKSPGAGPDTTTKAVQGSVNFSKYVAIGNSLTAGFQAGALFTDGQANSFPAILAKQLVAVGGSATFNQPDINSVNGYNSSVSDPTHNVILGRFILFAADGKQADAIPTPAGYPGVPAPYNTADLPGAFTGNKAALNNFGVPGIQLGQFLTADTGNPSKVAYNPLWARFASSPGVKAIYEDVIAAQPTFFTFELGANDALGYAITGGDGSIPLTPLANFAGYYQNAINALLNPGTNPNNPKGVLINIPDVTTLPYFYTVKWNAIPLDAATASTLTTNLANNYNAFLQGMVTNTIITAAEATQRTISYNAAANNAILITDENLTNLAPYMAGPYAGLLPYAKARQTTSTDLIPLATASILGTEINNDPTLVWGVSVPLGDKYILVKAEVDSITSAVSGYNTTISSVVTAVNSGGTKILGLVDFNSELKMLDTYHVLLSNNVAITPDFTPPTGAFSEDGVHPNSRGYAYMTNIIIDAINRTFGGKVKSVNIGDYKGVGLPLVP